MYYLKTNACRFVEYPLVSPLIHLAATNDTTYLAICGHPYTLPCPNTKARGICVPCRNVGVRDRLIREGTFPYALRLDPVMHQNLWTVEMSDSDPIEEIGYRAAQRSVGPFYSRGDALYYVARRLYDTTALPSDVPHIRIEDILAILAERYRMPMPEIDKRPGGLQVKVRPGEGIGKSERVVADILTAGRAIGYGIGSVNDLGSDLSVMLPYGSGWTLE